MKKREQQSYFVPALEKGLDVLEALAEATVPQTLSELARLLSRTSSELFRMIDALEKRSYIIRDPVSGRYRLTLKLYELAHTHSPVDQLLSAAQDPMRELANTIHESCHLSVMSREKLLVIAQAESPEPVRLSIEVGSRIEPLRTVSGMVLIAFMEAETQRKFLKLHSAATHRKFSRFALQAELAKIRKRGWHFAQSTRRTGLDVSHIVGNASIGVSAALGIPFLEGGANQGREKQTIPAIRDCACQITTALGLTWKT